MTAGEYLQTPLQFLKGVGPRKAADFTRAGLSTIEDLLFRFPAALRRPQPPADDRVAPRRPDGLDCRRDHHRRTARHAASGRADLRGVAPRRVRHGAPVLVQLGVPEGSDQAAHPDGRVRHVRAQPVDGPADHQPAVRGHRQRRDRDASHRPYRPDLRTRAVDHSEDAAEAGGRRVGGASRRSARAAAGRRAPGTAAAGSPRRARRDALPGRPINRSRCSTAFVRRHSAD